MKRDVFRTAGTLLTIGIGLYAVYLGGMHGYYEILNGSRNPHAIFFDAISGNPLAADFPGWPGWPAMSIVPNLLISGIMVEITAGALLLWLVLFSGRRKWGIWIVILALVLCLFGGGFKPPFFAAAAGVAGILVKRPDRQPKG
jgi:hypothetical protein